jgi:hypothetical protein
MAFRVGAVLHLPVLLLRLRHRLVVHLPQQRLAELPLAGLLQVAADVVVAVVDVAELLPQSSCTAQSRSFRCGSEFQDRTTFPELIFQYALPFHPLLDSPRRWLRPMRCLSPPVQSS